MDYQKNSLELKNLRISFSDYTKRETQAVKGLNFDLAKRQNKLHWLVSLDAERR